MKKQADENATVSASRPLNCSTARSIEEGSFWDGFCHDCQTEWQNLEEQNCCPNCGSNKCDLYEVDAETY